MSGHLKVKLNKVFEKTTGENYEVDDQQGLVENCLALFDTDSDEAAITKNLPQITNWRK